MFVPCIPTIPRTTVINKTIVYCDTVLSLKDLGSNLHVSSITGVSESDLENCLKTIFKSNPDVVFNTIQYSRNDKKVYFYTNKVISTNEYQESKFKVYKPITTKTEILEEIKDVLMAPKCMNKEYVSLYDVMMLNREISSDYDNIERKYSSELKSNLASKLGNSSSICIHKFDYEKNLLHVSAKRWSANDYDDIYFTKEDGDLRVVKSESCWTDEIFSAISSTLSKMFDEYILYKEFKNWDRSKNGIKSINSNFIVDINCYGVSIYVNNPNNRYKHEFKLFAPSYTSDYSTECNSSIVIDAVKGNEREILKNIYVDIRDCPIWMQGILHMNRKKQVENDIIEENKRLAKEENKQKRLKLLRRIFPFIQK